jgi:diadenosine tetraphosphate (Ap4A) HIT family hydrolase
MAQPIASGAVAVAPPAERFHAAALQSCVFCNPDHSLVVYESPKLLIMFDPFPVVSGQLLLAAKDHYGCLGEVPADDLDEHEELRRKAEAFLRRVYGPAVGYERS